MKVKWKTGVSGAGINIKPNEISDTSDPQCPLDKDTLKRYAASGACDIIEQPPARDVKIETAMVAPQETAVNQGGKARKRQKSKGGTVK